ncbi:MAG: hypothetical protein JRH17_21685 [Deltaproteobacteria bacterium]|nr:hypothetical protein [Deltaproteobacteria bacterium]
MRFAAALAAAVALALPVSLIMTITPGSACAERAADPSWEISGLAGGGFGGSIDISTIDDIRLNNTEINLAPGWAYQGIIGLRLRSDEGRLITVSYSRQRSAFDLTGLNVPPLSIDMDMGVVQIGGEIDGKIGKHFKPFFGLGIGATHYSPLSSQMDTEWFFSGTVFGGLKFAFNEHFGIRTQGRMIGTLLNADSTIFCRTGTGCVVTINEVSGPISGDLMAGIYVAF